MGSNTSIIAYKCNSRYQGQLLNNQPHGKGKYYINNNSSSFNPKISLSQQNTQYSIIQGQFKQGKLLKCKLKTKSGFIYEGNIRQNQLQGQAILIDKQNNIYQGIFDNQGKLLKGKITSNSQTLNSIKYLCQTQGEFIGTSIINGQGKYYNITDNYLVQGSFYKGNLSQGNYFYHNGDLYKGQFINGTPNGQGIYQTKSYVLKQIKSNSQNYKQLTQINSFYKQISSSNKQNIQFVYKGQFINKQPSGKGQLLYENRDKFKGKFKQSKMHGYGQYTFNDGTIYKGNFYMGQMTGQCNIQYTPQSLININKKQHEILQKYQGQVSECAFHGLGVLYYANGVIFKGYFLNGAKNGPGILIYCQKKYKCLYLMNKLIGEVKLIQS